MAFQYEVDLIRRKLDEVEEIVDEMSSMLPDDAVAAVGDVDSLLNDARSELDDVECATDVEDLDVTQEVEQIEELASDILRTLRG